MKKIGKKQIRYAAAAFILAVCIVALASQVRNIELFLARDDIENALQTYFSAEMNQNFKAVYASLAPSSIYRKSHTYDEFLSVVEDSPVQFAHYEIVGIYNLRKNTD